LRPTTIFNSAFGQWTTSLGLLSALIAGLSFTFVPLVAHPRPNAPAVEQPPPTLTPPPPPPPELFVLKSASSFAAGAGSVLTYTVLLVNDSVGAGDPGSSVSMVDSIPAGTTFLRVHPYSPGEYDRETNSFRWRGRVPLHEEGNPDSDRALSFAVRIRPEAPVGTIISNTAIITDALGRRYEPWFETEVDAPAPTIYLPRLYSRR
jgi:uncharacterized repeat protein (TIGR01451 family)